MLVIEISVSCDILVPALPFRGFTPPTCWLLLRCVQHYADAKQWCMCPWVLPPSPHSAMFHCLISETWMCLLFSSAQGRLGAALRYLDMVPGEASTSVAVLKDRIYRSVHHCCCSRCCIMARMTDTMTTLCLSKGFSDAWTLPTTCRAMTAVALCLSLS